MALEDIQGIPHMPSKAMVNQFVAMEQYSLYNIMQHCPVYKKFTLPVSAILTVRLLVPGIYQNSLWSATWFVYGTYSCQIDISCAI